MRRGARARAVRTESAPLFAALGDRTRLELIARLSAHGPQSITGLTRGLTLSRQAITKHLRVLDEVGLVRSAAVGRENRWTATPQRLDLARRYLDLVAARWDDKLQALARHLAETPD